MFLSSMAVRKVQESLPRRVLGASGLVAIVLAVAIPCSAWADTPAGAQRPQGAESKAVNVQAGELTVALKALANQLGVDVVYVNRELEGLKTRGVSGNLGTREAFEKLLEGTPLVMKEEGRSVMVRLPRNTADAGANEADVSLRLAQAEGGDTGEGTKSEGGSRDAKQQAGSESRAGEEKGAQLEEIVVTGSRLLRATKNGAQQVQIYTREEIDRSGQTTMSDFLNTLPAVSSAVSENGFEVFGGSTTVKLHGLPLGTTLVLLNGRRVGSSGLQSATDFFDLNNIPLAAVQSVEIVPAGSSAVYGSDAIAGVVNVILKKDFNGIEASTKYSHASGINESSSSLALGKSWEKLSVSVIGSYLTRDELLGTEREPTRNNSPFPLCDRANIISADGVTPLPGLGSATFAAVPAGLTGPVTAADFSATAGVLNSCGIFSFGSFIPATHRSGALAQVTYALSPSTEAFAEFLWSHSIQLSNSGTAFIFGQPGFVPFTVAADNPFNPFGVAVGVSLRFRDARQVSHLDTTFTRPLVGVRGRLPRSWTWELSAWQSRDRTRETDTNRFQDNVAIQNALNSTDPATALNPFVDASAAADPALMRSFFSDERQRFTGRTEIASGFIRGPALQLPAGALDLVIGVEHVDTTFTRTVTDPPSIKRNSDSVFSELRVPVLQSVVASVAGRYDSYSDFGSKTTPQLGIEWRPLDSLLLRGTYGKAFKAPSLPNLHEPRATLPARQVFDPLRNELVFVDLITGGNPDLEPLTGQSRTFGFVYASQRFDGLEMGVTHWDIDTANSIAFLDSQTILNNEDIFAGRVVRAPGSNGEPGVILSVDASRANFGRMNVEGLNYEVSYRLATPAGVFTPSLNATQTYRYTAALLPGAPASDRTSKAHADGNFAPRWKGTVGLDWSFGAYSASLDGRYIGRYKDYDLIRDLGGFWIYDANLHYDLGKGIAKDWRWLAGSYLDLGGVNLLDPEPQRSNNTIGFLGLGYDPTQADLRGRFLYVQLGVKF